METALFKEAFHPQFDARGVQHILALIAVHLRCWRQAVAAFVFIDQRVDIAVADAIHHLHQIADRPGVDREAELNLRRHFITVGYRHFSHVIAEAAHFQMAGILLRNRLTHPRADALVRFFILPVAGDDAVLLAHARADKAEFAAAVRGLVEVHKVHINAVPWQGGVELGMELQQRLVEKRQAVNPHFRR